MKKRKNTVGFMKTCILSAFLLGVSFFFSGCYASHPAKIHSSVNYASIAPKVIPQEARTPGSLWIGVTSNNLYFADNRARGIGDLVTVKIADKSTATKKATTKTSRGSSIDAGIPTIMGIEKGLEAKNKDLSMSQLYKASMSNKFDGSGETTRAGELKATITCMVIRVLPNGNLVIQGDKDVQVNNETQFVRLYGIIRPQDIEQDNSISSDKIADARIVYSGRGIVSDKQIGGWGTKILDWIWPF